MTEAEKQALLDFVHKSRREEEFYRNVATEHAKDAARLIRAAAAAGIPQKDIMEAAGIKRTRLHEIIHGKQ